MRFLALSESVGVPNTCQAFIFLPSGALVGTVNSAIILNILKNMFIFSVSIILLYVQHNYPKVRVYETLETNLNT